VKPETEEFAKIAVSKTKEEDSSQHIN